MVTTLINEPDHYEQRVIVNIWSILLININVADLNATNNAAKRNSVAAPQGQFED